MRTPQSLLYTPEHIWTRLIADDIWEAGVTDYAQDLLGDIVFIDAPAVGSKLAAGQPCGLIESVKTGSDLHAPANGEVIEVNTNLADTPEQVNDDPYKAWLFRYKAQDADIENKLLSAEAYQALINAL